MAEGRWVAGLSCALALLGLSAPCFAQPVGPGPGEIEGRVIEVQEGDLVLDLGAGTGLRDGQRVQIWRPILVRHPVTKKTLSDRFLLGELELVQVRPSMTLARPASGLTRVPALGDIILSAAVAPASPPPSPSTMQPSEAASSPAAPASKVDVRAERIGKLLHALRGADPMSRVGAYEDLARADPGSPYASALQEEARALRAAARENGPPAPIALKAPIVDEVRRGEPLRISAEIVNAPGAVLHVRTSDDPSFVSLPMEPASGSYFAATIPGSAVDGATLELFIEAVGEGGRPVAVVGSADDPMRASVRAPKEAPARDDFRATAKLWTDYADYNRLRGDDYAWQTEGEFGLRLGDEGVRAIRSGFGVYRGRGGSVEDLDERGLEARSVGLTYGYLEGELAPARVFAILPRAVVGLGDDGVAVGGQLLFRIGNDLETNLLLGGEALGTVGVRGIAQLELAVFERVPILFRTEVSNQPAGAGPSSADLPTDGASPSLGGSDVGARGIAEVGYRLVGDLVIRARGSFQGRTIEHAGPGFGGGVSYSW